MEDEEIKIDTAVPISLHSAVFTHMEGVNDDVRPYLTGAVAAFDAAGETLSEINQLRILAEKNPALTPDAKIIQVGVFAERKLTEVYKTFDYADATLKKQMAFFDAELQRPLELTTHVQAAAEIRSLVRVMEPGERRKSLTDAIESGDQQLLSAVLPAHTLTTGLTKVEVEAFTRKYREKTNPAVAHRLAVMTKAQEILRDRAGLVRERAEKLVGADPQRVRELRNAEARFTKAFAK